MPIERLRARRSFVTEFIEIVPGAVYAKDRAGRILLGNQAFAEAVGWPNGDFIGKTDLELLADKELALTVMANDRSVMERRGRAQLEEMLRAADGTESYWLSTKAPFSDEEGDVVGLVGVSVEITERKRLAERDRLLAREIEHRNKNLLGIAQSIVRMTRAPGVEAYREAVLGRFAALGRVQGLLGDGRQEIGLETLLADELDAYNIDTSERIQLSGPPINVGSDAAQPLAMAVHELATNASKYGAFAQATGRLAIAWARDGPDGPLRIEWRESGDGVIAAPDREGFGTTLIRSIVEGQLAGTLELAWEPDGLRCAMELPADVLARS